MRFTSLISVLSTAMLLQACGGDDGSSGGMSFSPSTAQTVAAGAKTTYTLDGLTDGQAYRVTLVLGANITVAGDSATFLDNDDNGAADAGLSENVALITKLNDQVIAGVKTFPGGMDNPASPTGILPVDGRIVVEITGVAAGTVVPVAYPNSGASTFLEIGDDGAPVENYAIGGALTVSGSSGSPVIIPNIAQTLPVEDSIDYTIYGLNDGQAYRITLVLAANASVNFTEGTFLDNDGNGAADAGASENVALITAVNGTPVTGTKTVPEATDNPASPTGVIASGGKITVTITGVAAGEVYPVAYVNAGASTFLELDPDGVPAETYSIGGKIIVQ